MPLSPEIFEKILEDIENSSDGVQRIVESYGYDIKQFYRFVNLSETNCQRYARAKEKQCDNIADDMFRLADQAEDSNKARVQVDVRKFYLAKIKPKRYGDHQVLEITSTISNIMDNIIPIILRYVPEDKRNEAMTALQAAVDFNKP
jgi:hypothetical protein